MSEHDPHATETDEGEPDRDAPAEPLDEDGSDDRLSDEAREEIRQHEEEED